jgi:hypothetical protein
MISIIIYYLVLPFFFASLVLKFIKKYGASQIKPDVTAMLAIDPVEKRFYRAARRDAQGLSKLQDWEKHEEAVDAIYASRQEAAKAGRRAEFIVLNDKGETLDWIESQPVAKPKA